MDERDRRRAARRLEAGCARGLANASSRRNYAWALGRDLGNFAAAGLVDDVAGWEARIAAATVAVGIPEAEALRQVKSGIKAGLAESWAGFSDTVEWADWKAKRGAAPAGPRRAEAPRPAPPSPPSPPSAASALQRVGDLLSAVLGRLSPRLPAPSPEPPPEPMREPPAGASICEPEVIPAPGPLEAPPDEVPLWRWCWRALGLDLAAVAWRAVRPGEPFAGDPESYEAAINVEHLPQGAVVAVVSLEAPEVTRRAVLVDVRAGAVLLVDLEPDGTWCQWSAHASDVRGWCGAVLRPEDGAASVAALGALAALVAA